MIDMNETLIHTAVKFVFVATFSVVIGACSFDVESRLNEAPLVVQEDNYHNVYVTENISQATIADEARRFHRYGYDAMRLTVTYDAASRHHSALWASQKSSELAAALRQQGVNNLAFDVMPVKNSVISQTIISYVEMTARGPKDCIGTGPDGEIMDDDYQFGCSVKDRIAKQIYRPADMVKSKPNDKADAARQSVIVDTYRSGQQNAPLVGERASGE